MIDFHCHIDLYPDPAKILEEVDLHKTYVLAVTTTPKAWRGTRKLVGDRKRVRTALGLHPEVVAQRHAESRYSAGFCPKRDMSVRSASTEAPPTGMQSASSGRSSIGSWTPAPATTGES